MNPFDFVNSITTTKNNLMENDPLAERDYVPFVVNRALSYFPDTIFAANAMNTNAFLDKKIQYEYLFHSVSKKKRFSKWHKPEEDARIEAIVTLFKCSIRQAKQTLKILKSDQIDKLMAEYRHLEGK
jgi:hypothetical protein